MSIKPLDEIRKKLQLLEFDQFPDLKSLKLEQTRLENAVFYKITRILTDAKIDTVFALASIFSSFRHMDCRLAFIVCHDTRFSFYVGLIPADTASTVSGQALHDAFTGVFRGSRLEIVNVAEPVAKVSGNECFYAVTGIPSISQENTECEYFHMDSLAHAMGSRYFSIMILWDNVSEKFLKTMADNLNNIYEQIVPWIKNSLGNSESNSEPDKNANSKDASKGKSKHRDWEETQKDLQLLQKCLDEELLPRMTLALAKGMFNTAVYLAAKTKEDLKLLGNLFTGIFQSHKPSRVPLRCLYLPDAQKARLIMCFMRICGDIPVQSGNFISLLSRPLQNGMTSLSTWLTSYEIGIMARLPVQDMLGLETDKRVAFGVNLPDVPSGAEIRLGHTMEDGNVDQQRCVNLNREDLERHIFISGTTGSGKTSTCHRILNEFSSGFMVLEPAKTEYRDLLSDASMKDLLVFTVGSEKGAPFRLNPFEFFQDETISAHIDLLKGCFMASFEMEAAIPNILEQAMYRLYDNFGWDISTDTNRFLKNKADAWNDPHGLLFPTISDYIKVVVDIVEEKGFSERLRDDYIGSLRGRLESLTAGSKGLMLNTRRSIDFNDLLDKKVVLELEELKSGEDKAFVMALILGRLVEALKSRYRNPKKGEQFHHILLFEEAHRLLSSPAAGDSQGKRLGVEMFTDLLAEVRKYHECLVVVDQVPSKLAPEILKNTSTKIVHTLFSRDDREALGNAMSLDREQMEYISKLETGQAIVKSRGWPKAVHVSIEWLGELVPVDQLAINSIGRKFWENHPDIFCANLPSDTGRRYSMNILRNMNNMAARLAKALPKSLDDKEKTKWRAFVKEARAEIGGDAEEFLKVAIASLIMRRSLRENKVENLELAKRQARNLAHHIIAWNETELMSVLNNYNWGN